MSRRYDAAYKIKRGDDLGDPEVWNRRFEDIDVRIHAREDDSGKLDRAAGELVTAGLARLNETVMPLVEQSTQAMAQAAELLDDAQSLLADLVDGIVDDGPFSDLPAKIKLRHSSTPDAVPVSLASGQLAINEADGKLFWRSNAGGGTVMSFDLTLTDLASEGWVATQLADYATTTSVTALFAGYATTAWVSTQINNLIGAAPGQLNTLVELAAALDNNENYAAAVTAALADLKTAVGGQCVLSKVGSNIVLLPCKGNRIVVDGVICTIPPEGVSLAPTGLTVDANFNIFARRTGSVVSSLEASATAHAQHTDGTEIKSGDATRAMVGRVRTVAGPAFADSETQRFVRSWFNRRAIALQFTLSGVATASTAPVVLTGRAYALVFADETLDMHVSGNISNNTASGANWTAVMLNEGAVGSQSVAVFPNANWSAPVACDYAAQLSAEGLISCGAFGSVSVGVGTWNYTFSATIIPPGV